MLAPKRGIRKKFPYLPQTYGWSVPSVDFEAQDLTDTAHTVTPATIAKDYKPAKRAVLRVEKAWIPMDLMPEPRLVEEEDGDPDAGYDWSELRYGRGKPPPPKVALRDGELVILDGNHRIKFWQERGYSHVPAWLIIEGALRKPSQRRA